MHASTRERTTRRRECMDDWRHVIKPCTLEEWEGLVPSDYGTPWLYQPRGPFQVQMCHQSARPELTSWTVLPTLDSAVDKLVADFLPPRRGYMCEIVDESFRQILCAAYHDKIWDHGGAWFGCHAGFVELRVHPLVDPVSVDAWEGIARYTAPGGGRS